MTQTVETCAWSLESENNSTTYKHPKFQSAHKLMMNSRHNLTKSKFSVMLQSPMQSTPANAHEKIGLQSVHLICRSKQTVLRKKNSNINSKKVMAPK